jgi:DNA-binding transcriptional LysR family regulator
MERVLDIVALRSLVAVADRGGFQRAATYLHLSQPAVSQHVRRLEAATGRRLVERDGRRSRFTSEGEVLLGHARQLLALHDEALRGLGVDAEDTVLIGSTEHGAARLLPHLSETLGEALPDRRIRVRIDRGAALREALITGRLDLALLLGPADDPRATPVGELDLTWYSAPGWHRPRGPVLLVAFDNPCALRARALETLIAHRIPAEIGVESTQLAGVHAAVAAGLGVALLATTDTPADGLVARNDLPVPEPIPLAVWCRQGLDPALVRHATTSLRRLLTAPFARGA